MDGWKPQEYELLMQEYELRRQEYELHKHEVGTTAAAASVQGKAAKWQGIAVVVALASTLVALGTGYLNLKATAAARNSSAQQATLSIQQVDENQLSSEIADLDKGGDSKRAASLRSVADIVQRILALPATTATARYNAFIDYQEALNAFQSYIRTYGTDIRKAYRSTAYKDAVGGLRTLLLGRTISKVQNLQAGHVELDISHDNFIGQDLHGVFFFAVDAVQIGGTHAVFIGAYLAGASLAAAYLPHAQLQCANLTGADLEFAQLNNADLRFAIVEKAKFRSAKLAGALTSHTSGGEVGAPKGLFSHQLKLDPLNKGCNKAIRKVENSK